MNRPRQRATLCSLVLSSAATALFSLPSAQASTIRARSASPSSHSEHPLGPRLTPPSQEIPRGG